MNPKKIRGIGAAVLAALWLALTALAWFGPKTDISEAERRQLAKMPQITGKSVLDGRFMEAFNTYTLEQFPLRNTFRQTKALFHYYVMRQADKNDLYLHDGYVVKQEYPLNTDSVAHAVEVFTWIYEKLLKDSGCKAYFVAVPDKNYYLGKQSGHLTMDYEAMFAQLRTGMPWAEHISITDCLTYQDYYRTDTHWRQEKLIPTANRICQAMGVAGPGAYTRLALEKPFYGVYYGQSAMPMEPETLYYLTSPMLESCQVDYPELKKTAGIYNLEMGAGRDPYEVFLSGSRSMLTITNPNAKTERELIVFRDSFGSSITPLLLEDYRTVTVLDIRYLLRFSLANMVDFHGQDVLFLYSTSVLNNSSTIK